MSDAVLSSEEMLDIDIERLTFGGEGLGFVDGLPIFVRGTAPGDRARVRITRRGTRHAFGEIVEMLHPSARRVTPRCPVFGECGGCDWQHLTYEAQVAGKTEIVREQLTRMAKLSEPLVYPCIAAATPWHYRSRIHLQRDAQGRVGFYAHGSHRVVEFDQCYIADERLNAALAQRKVLLAQEDRGRDFRVESGAGFAQVNPEQNANLQTALVAHIATQPRARTIVELFAGSGNFTLAIAPYCEQLIAVENHAGLVQAGRATAKTHEFTHIAFHQTSAESFMKNAVQTHLAIDGLVLDPPRRGAAETIVAIRTLAPRWIAYISCDTATLARDIRSLTDVTEATDAKTDTLAAAETSTAPAGATYRHIFTKPFDMFPQTHHIETFTWLEKV